MQFRSVPPDTGDTYRSARLPEREQAATGWTTKIDRRRSIEGEIDRRLLIEGEKGKKKKKRKRRKKKKRRKREKYLLACGSLAFAKPYSTSIPSLARYRMVGVVASFLLPTGETFLLLAWGESSCGEKKSPAGNGSRSGKQRRVSRFSLFFSLFFFLPRLILLEIARRRSKSTITARQWLAMVEIDHYQPISDGNGAEKSPIDGTDGTHRLTLDSGVTRPPPLLSEADLLSCMDKLIGTRTARYWAASSIGVVSASLPPEIDR
ncbi:hypothetical protein BHM03_00007524 [Ensete ventricosum]|nr:hypothetical protein BHM03_00007524 [Ensete ventricosum]